MELFTQDVAAGHRPPKRVRMPAKMLRAYKHSTNEDRALFDMSYQRLTESGLSFYPTDCPDFRAKHPQNDLVFVILRFQEVSGTRIEIRVDSLPTTLWNQIARQRRQVKQYDANSKAQWAVCRIDSPKDLDTAMELIETVEQIRPAWGNL